MELTERVNLPVDELTELLAALEAQPPDARERFLRSFVEAWLIHQGEAYDAEQHGGDDGEGRMRKKAVPLEDVVLAQAFQLGALLNVLERKGVAWKAEVTEEIKRLRAKAVKTR